MKKFLILPLIALAAFVLSSCDSTTDNPPAAGTGSIFVQSTPAGAQIFVDGSNTNKVTPDSVVNLSEGTYNVQLQLTNYRDTSFAATVTANFQTVKSVTLTSDLSTKTYTDTIWETTGTGANQPSGLDLSAGVAKSSSNADIDLYYFSSTNTFEIRSSTTRSTSFKVGGSSNLSDGVPSPLATNAWDTKMSDRETNYVFLFDADLHYSKLKIISFGGGTPGSPAYLVVQYIYNEKVNDIRFPTTL